MTDQAWPARLAERTSRLGPLCVGIDPHPEILQAWGLTDDADGLERCALTMVEALVDEVAVFKPQAAFFEAYGSAGVAALERVLATIRELGGLSVLDVKRGDIGSTMAGYARAYLGAESSLRADAVTVSPYLGVGSLRPAIELAAETGRGLYILARTSNPDGGSIQTARTETGESVAQHVVDQVHAYNEQLGSNLLGLVVGGTHTDTGVDLTHFGGSVLVPGIGAQGGRVEDLPQQFGPALAQVLVTTSRGVMSAGPDPDKLRSAARATVTAMRTIVPARPR